MKNITLIKNFVANYVHATDEDTLIKNIANLVIAHPNDVRENIMAILTGSAELTVRPKDQVEIICVTPNRSDPHFNKEATIDLLRGVVSISVSFTRTEVCWYKSKEDADADRNRYWCEKDDYHYKAVRAQDSESLMTFDLTQWNTGTVKI